MAVITRRGKIWIDVYVRLPGRHARRVQRQSPVQTKRAALAFEKEILEREYGLSGKPEKTLEQFVLVEFRDYVAANNSISEYERKQRVLKNRVLPFFGHMYLSDIASKDIEAYKAQRAFGDGAEPGSRRGGPASPKTIINELSVLRKALSLAKRFGDLESLPHFEMPKQRPQTFDFLDFDEAARLIGAADGEWKTMILVALRTGLRIGELRALHWEDVDLVRGVIHVRRNATIGGQIKPPKSNRFRDVPLGAEVLAALKAHRHLRGPFVFCDAAGRMWKEHETKHPCKRAAKRAGIRTLFWHAFRHTFASHLAMRGVALLTIKELLGHTTLAMTQRYAHLSPNVPREAVGLLDAAPAGKRGAK